MRDLHLQAIDRKIQRIRFYKLIGKMIFATILIILLILIFSNLNNIMMMQTDILNQQNNILLELDKQSIDEGQESSLQVNSEPLTGEAREIVERVVAAEARG